MEGPRPCAVADAGEAILADPERFSIHLDATTPTTLKRIRSSVSTPQHRPRAGLDASERRERHQSLSEDEKTARTPFTATPRRIKGSSARHNAGGSSDTGWAPQFVPDFSGRPWTTTDAPRNASSP